MMLLAMAVSSYMDMLLVSERDPRWPERACYVGRAVNPTEKPCTRAQVERWFKMYGSLTTTYIEPGSLFLRTYTNCFALVDYARRIVAGETRPEIIVRDYEGAMKSLGWVARACRDSGGR
jgi:hypothetical protein